MKKLIFASAAAIIMSAAASYAQDSESLTYNLNGSIASNCEIVPEGVVNVNVDMLNFGNQGLAAVAYSCNSPYELTIQSANGGMEHQESGGAIVILYDVETFGFFNTTGNGPQSFNSAAIVAPQVVATETSWANILVNGGLQLGNIDLVFPGLANSNVAGTYEDQLTLTLTAIL
ncbi:MAG: hypothetical protein ACXIVO_01810 [Glycocaulis sp.]